MMTISPDDLNLEEIVSELLDGSGAVRLPKLFDAEQVREAREIIVHHSDPQEVTGSHFNKDDEDAKRQRRVWNLLGKGKVFGDMVQHPAMAAIMKAFLGSDFVMGSICGSRLLPGFQGQEPHIDYPYWDLYRAKSFPSRINASFPLNAQATIVIDPFTELSGATAFKPGSQKLLSYPLEPEEFFRDYRQMIGDPGDVIIFFGAAWHCAMPNRTDRDRIGILIEFLPKFVKPVEDMLTDLDPQFLEEATPMLRQLLGLAYPWPSSPPNPPLAA